MNYRLAIEIARYKMKELGLGSQYTLRFRHILQKENENKQINAGSDYWILINPNSFTKITSNQGIFDLNARNVNELQYVFTGIFKLINLNQKGFNATKFLQVIPMKTP